MRLWVWALALLSGWRIWRCLELWCRSQTWLRFHIAVAVAWAGGWSSDWTPSLVTSICHRCGPRKDKKKKKEEEEVTCSIYYFPLRGKEGGRTGRKKAREVKTEEEWCKMLCGFGAASPLFLPIFLGFTQLAQEETKICTPGGVTGESSSQRHCLRCQHTFDSESNQRVLSFPLLPGPLYTY